MRPTERCDAAFDRLGGQFPLGPMGDGPPAVARILAGQGDDRAGILGAVGGRRTGARGISQAFGDTVACAHEPTPPPVANRCAGDAQARGTRLNANAFAGKQHDPGAQRHVLGAGLLTDQRFEVAALAFAQREW